MAVLLWHGLLLPRALSSDSDWRSLPGLWRIIVIARQFSNYLVMVAHPVFTAHHVLLSFRMSASTMMTHELASIGHISMGCVGPLRASGVTMPGTFVSTFVRII